MSHTNTNYKNHINEDDLNPSILETIKNFIFQMCGVVVLLAFAVGVFAMFAHFGILALFLI